MFADRLDTSGVVTASATTIRCSAMRSPVYHHGGDLELRQVRASSSASAVWLALTNRRDRRP